ncbi:hypothetical protein RchiOBHm_Chr6g0260521 [Rosa chinensis]|uniref:Uncharacterized protein n=1 Tax=Rosa chinensis TaxID=74649 RepID=A0A2P6PN41_ROSCH|nr:hypothetical protein RchiOBHm_Chr6g0260521 [Rosa chinensis]
MCTMNWSSTEICKSLSFAAVSIILIMCSLTPVEPPYFMVIKESKSCPVSAFSLS